MKYGPLGLLLLLACSAPPTVVTVGSACRYDADLTCETGSPRLLECRAQKWALSADCRGPGGCVSDAMQTVCDTSGDTVGDHCSASSEGKARCDPVAPFRIIRCARGVFEVAIECPQQTRCGLDPDAGLVCG